MSFELPQNDPDSPQNFSFSRARQEVTPTLPATVESSTDSSKIERVVPAPTVPSPAITAEGIAFAQTEDGVGVAKTQERPTGFEDGELQPGQILKDAGGGQYLIERKLGAGGMGGVYKVEDMRTGMIRAVKFMHPEMQAERSSVVRFQREISALSQIQNPFIVTAHFVEEFNLEGKEVIGLAMDYVDGPTLESLVEKAHPMETKRLATLAAQMSFGLDSLHRAGMVHRDFKPANIFIKKMDDGEEFVRIGDFGIVSFAFEKDQPHATDEVDNVVPILGKTALTGTGSVIGTPDYMSPESVQGMPVDHRSDLYSLGLVMYNMATGAEPFRNTKDLAGKFKAQMTETPKSFQELGITDVPPWLESIIFKLLEKKAEDRFQSAAEVFVALKEEIKDNYPELSQKIPFSFDLKPRETYATSTKMAA